MLLNGAGFYMYYAVELTAIKREMRAALKRLPDEQLHVLMLTRKQFANARQDDDEIRINGKMYDVARTRPAGDYIAVYCLHDEAEDNLLAFITEVVTKPLTSEDSLPEEIIQYLTLTFIHSENIISFGTLDKDLTGNNAYYFTVKAYHAIPDAPPPWKGIPFLA
jgi:hypothetical protein